jgi:hypothetical protein
MSVGDFVKGVIGDVLEDMLKKATGSGKRRRRRRALTPTERLSRIEKLLKPAAKKTSRKKSTASRATAQQRRTKAKTQSHRRSLRKGAATR